ncbi:unnamed protein product [Chondrus crispus]|uniref:Uncharacterized protein n=1 Tax=Chondrus crispus TaxID=2769 RepID=R7QS48_CHOCR|nr:unnamed protein product [Chondrus crispus]CDF41312.1 unnamed protein product [Chondrus crispus]|eukprot:XP_005711606.1 unnamed protein product [Chondrus crispus]
MNHCSKMLTNTLPPPPPPPHHYHHTQPPLFLGHTQFQLMQRCLKISSNSLKKTGCECTTYSQLPPKLNEQKCPLSPPRITLECRHLLDLRLVVQSVTNQSKPHDKGISL